MPYTAAQLATIYTNIHAGLAPTAAQTALLNAYAAQNNAGTLTDAATLQSVIDTADADSAVAITSYQFFTGTSPSAAGLAYLVNSTTNTTDLNDAYYQNFNQTNRYINFAANLGTGAGAGATGFAAAYGALSFNDAVSTAYETVIGSNNAAAAGIDAAAGKAFIASQLPYFTALAAQNFPTADAATRDLIIKAEMVGYIISEAIKANIGTYANATSALLGDLGPDNTANLGTDLLASYAASSVTLTVQPDTLTANVFNAPRVFTPGGTDQVNSLNDDDVLTGAGTNPTLNFTYVNDVDSGDQNINPTLNNIQTVNVAFATDASSTLDLQDATGVKAVNITRISGNAPNAYITNLTSVPTLSITNSSVPTGNVAFEFAQSAVAGAADATTLTLSNVNIGGMLYVEQTGPNVGTNTGAITDGIETLTLVSTGSANKVAVIDAEDLKSLIITGGQKLTLGATTNVNNAGQVEAINYAAGLNNVAASLTSIDASAMTAALDISVGAETVANLEDTSGTPVNFTIKTGSGDDTIRLLAGLDGKGDTVDGGTGVNTVQVFDSVTLGSLTNIQNLDVRSGHVGNDIKVDTALFPQLTSITVRNEGNTNAAPPANSAPAVVPATFTLTNLTATTAAAITALHGTTGNNDIASSTIVATLATDTASDTVGLTIKDGVNIDPRSNFTLTAGTAKGGANVVENITITDSDTESNGVLLTNFDLHTGTITLNGGQVGNFLDLDVTANGLMKDFTGGATDDKGWVDPGAGAAERLVATTIAGGSFVGDLILRVGNPAGAAGAQSITTGSGNDTVIFDAITGVGQTTAGLSISDTVAAGAGTDTLVIDGNGALINISASEWTNVSGFENLRLVGQGGGAGAADALGSNQYNITLTNDFITHNSTLTGSISRIAIINDNDPGNDKVGTADNGATSLELGVTIDARQLDATHSFSYNGEEGASLTNDRFIMSDANINGAAIIDGGAVLGGGNVASNLANGDVLEIRNAAVVTIGDLANVSNVGTLEFTNDTAAVQNSVLQLDDATVDRLVNSTRAAAAGFDETLTIKVLDNSILPTATTGVTIDTTALTSAFLHLNVTGGGGADVINGGVAADTLNGGAGADILTGGGGADHFVFGSGSSGITLATADTIVDFSTLAAQGDKIDTGLAGATEATIADGSGLADFAAFVAAADGVFAVGPGANDGIYVAYNAANSGNTWVVVDQNDNGSVDAGDSVVVLTGISLPSQIVLADFV